MSCDLEVTNESAHCWEEISNYMTRRYIPYSHIVQKICVIDQACSVKMAGYWPSYFFFFLWTKKNLIKVNRNATKNESNIQPSSVDKLGQ